jgi:hypothetical protein
MVGAAGTSQTPNVTTTQFTFNASTGTITANIFAATNNNNGTNFKVGDDSWIGDINIANTFRVTGQQDGTQGYIVFGNSNALTLGRSGTGALTYQGGFTASGGLQATPIGNATPSTAIFTTQSVSGNSTVNGLTVNNSVTIGTTLDVTSNIIGNGYISANNQVIIQAPSPTSEGAQIVMAWANTSGLSGQGNSTWNIDVDNATNLRIFYQNSTGTTGVPITISQPSANVRLVGNIFSAGYFYPNGVSILSGGVGPQGPQGPQGPIGPIGNTGPQGPQGPQGPIGPIGNTGPQGPIGPIGNTGPQGPQGPIGPIGNTGPQGPQGPQGPIGPIGNTGPQGPTGPSTTINATAVTTGTMYPVLVGAAGSNQTANVRTTATAFSIDVATNILTVTATTARYADIAEKYESDVDYEPGTVLEFGGEKEVTKSSTDMSNKVAGVVTTNPAYLMNAQLVANVAVAVALQGRVPTKVVGPVGKGDMLVSTNDGRARAEADPKIGTIIGKSLENFVATEDQQESVIEVVIGKT